jgi:hypothetical protein
MSGTRPGSVMSTVPAGVSSLGTARSRSVSAASIVCFNALAAPPTRRRSSGGRPPSDFRSSVTTPCLRPRNRSRTAFRSVADVAWASAASASARMASRSGIEDM